MEFFKAYYQWKGEYIRLFPKSTYQYRFASVEEALKRAKQKRLIGRIIITDGLEAPSAPRFDFSSRP